MKEEETEMVVMVLWKSIIKTHHIQIRIETKYFLEIKVIKSQAMRELDKINSGQIIGKWINIVKIRDKIKRILELSSYRIH